MSNEMKREIERWTARRNSVLEIIRGKTIATEASRQFELQPSEVEERIDQGNAGIKTRCAPSLKVCASCASGT